MAVTGQATVALAAGTAHFTTGSTRSNGRTPVTDGAAPVARPMPPRDNMASYISVAFDAMGCDWYRRRPPDDAVQHQGYRVTAKAAAHAGARRMKPAPRTL